MTHNTHQASHAKGGKTKSENHMKYSILFLHRYVESSWGFIGIKTVSACSI